MTAFLNSFDAVLIDMDGVLFDSMKLHTLAWQRMMTEAGFDCTRDEFYLYEGMTGAATVNLIYRRVCGHDCPSDRIKELYALKSRYFNELGPALPMPEADRMIRAFMRAGLRRVLVTGSGQASLLDNVNAAYPGAFLDGDRVTAHDVKHGKPSPEPYQAGARIAGADPARCLAIENAPLGVRSAKAAGCFTVAVTTGPIPRREFEKENADLIFDSMPDFAGWLDFIGDFGRSGSGVLETADPDRDLRALVRASGCDRFWIVTDSNVERMVVPIFSNTVKAAAGTIVIPAGEENKDIAHASLIWETLSRNGATRRSLIVNIGGGVVSDLGGFAAATFKRGIRYINVPTTVLAACDAAIGGKTGIDFLGLKNEIGAFRMPELVLLAPALLSTLPRRLLVDGFAEVVKTALISSEDMWNACLEKDAPFRPGLLRRLVVEAARMKEKTVRMDPEEHGLRKILNFGHTAGHAFESMALADGRPVGHGTAVAWGMLYALRLSRERAGLPADVVNDYEEKILRRYYAPNPYDGEEERLRALMAHDKKNRSAGCISFVLLEHVGSPLFDSPACNVRQF